MEKCIGCELCAGVCPAKCIYVRGADNDPENPTSPGERFGFVYEINYLRCIHCDLCVEACPTEAITETKLFEFTFTNRQDAIYTKAELLVDDDGKPQQMPWEDWREGEDLTRAAGCAPPRRRGDADFVGEVGWSGELGYGVRAPRASAVTPCPIWARSATGIRARSVPDRDDRGRSGGTAALMELFVFVVASAMMLGGAVGVVLSANPVHAALSLVLTLFGVAVLFVAQEAHFLAAVQVIVYAGAIVVLFLFVIMLLGVDRAEDLRVEPIQIQRRSPRSRRRHRRPADRGRSSSTRDSAAAVGQPGSRSPARRRRWRRRRATTPTSSSSPQPVQRPRVRLRADVGAAVVAVVGTVVLTRATTKRRRR